MTATRTTLTRDDGVQLHLHAWEPEAAPRAVVVVAHGMAEHAARYDRLAQALVAEGYAVVAPDHRGHGLTAGDPEEYGFFADRDGWDTVVGDVRAVIRQAREQHAGAPVVLLGHSMGSLLSRTLAIRHGDEIDALVLSGTAGDPGPLGAVGLRLALAERRLRGGRHRSTLLDTLTFGGYNKAFRPTRTDVDWLSRDEAEVDAYVADPACGSVFTSGFYVDLLGAMREINDAKAIARMPQDLPIYLVAGDADPVGDSGKGVERLAQVMRHVGQADVTVRLYEGARHEIFNEINRDEVTADLLAWLEEHLPHQS